MRSAETVMLHVTANATPPRWLMEIVAPLSWPRVCQPRSPGMRGFSRLALGSAPARLPRPPQQLCQGGGGERWAACAQHIKDAAQAEKIGSRSQGQAIDLLGRHVSRRADQEAGFPPLRLFLLTRAAAHRSRRMSAPGRSRRRLGRRSGKRAVVLVYRHSNLRRLAQRGLAQESRKRKEMCAWGKRPIVPLNRKKPNGRSATQGNQHGHPSSLAVP